MQKEKKTWAIRGSMMAVLSTCLLVGGASCGTTEEEGAMTTSLQQELTTGAPPLPHHQLKQWLAAVNLRPDQKKTIDTLLEDTQTKMKPLRQAHAAILQELATEIRAGHLDRDRIQASVQSSITALEKAKPFMVGMLNQLHRTLDFSQREKLVSTMMEHHPKKHGHGPGPHHWLRPLAEKIGLTSEQGAQLRELAKTTFKEDRAQFKAHHQEMRQRRQGALEAFKSDNFDANTLDIFNHKGLTEHFQKGPFLTGMEKALTVLKPEQRTQLSEILSQHAKQIVQDPS